ncbi:MAG TPA: PilZ domain-containing protein [Candidatus Acidoferrales bacterium]|nr:PilZ domain-containing protein [Candidatus Acidoferrales bacterium]
MREAAKRVQRRYPRVGSPKEIVVAWQCGGMRTVSSVRTLGLGGLFILTSEPPPVGSMVKLIFELPNGDVRARATVRHSEPGRGMGVEFTGMGFNDRARLQQLLKRLLG